MVQRWEHPSRTSFWRALTVDERLAFADAAEERVYPAGTPLCEEGTWSTHVIVIVSGWAKVSVPSRDREQILAFRGPGDIVGERSAITFGARTASVTALGPVIGLQMPGPRFTEYLEDHLRVMQVLDHQERERTAEDEGFLRRADTTGVEEKLAFLLAELTFRRGANTPGGTTLSLPVSRNDVARWVDAEAEEVSEVLSSWRHRGMVSMAGGTVTVLDAHRLDEVHRGHLADRDSDDETRDGGLDLAAAGDDLDTPAAAAMLAAGLDRLFRRLGPPDAHLAIGDGG